MADATALPRWRRPLTWPAPWLNGASVALGVALLHALFLALGGPVAALVAVGGAVCVSLSDVPMPPAHVRTRLLPAVAVAVLVTLGVGLLRPWPWALGVLLVAVTWLSQMSLAWGPKAGPLSFTGTLAMVFAMGGPAPAHAGEAWGHVGWTLAGAAAYAVWAQGMAWALRRRYRELAVAEAVRATAQRMRSRADRIDGQVPAATDGIRASIRDDLALAEALQVARDHAYAARPSPHARRLVAVVIGSVELRDLLLASRLDLEWLGDDAPALAWRRAIAVTLREQAVALDQLADGLAAQLPTLLPTRLDPRAVADRLGAVPVPAADPRRVLVQALADRLTHVGDEVAAMARAWAAADVKVPLAPEQLARFVSPEGFAFAAWRPHLSMTSGVWRHAWRASLATAAAWVLALHLPWATHPHWLVLSVAVVLRGSLEQTLSRRNDRLLGTVLGCLAVAGLASLNHPGWLSPMFLVAVGTAHAFAVRRYLVTAVAATMMALMQPLMMAPGTPPAVLERLADTALGAALAWAACFVWPAWERHTVQRLTRQLLAGLSAHAHSVLAPASDLVQPMAQRLSRQQAYAALAALAAAARRNSAEPERVRLPDERLDLLLLHAWRVMALLGTVGQSLRRRGHHLDQDALRPDLAQTLASLVQAGASLESVAVDAPSPPASEGRRGPAGQDWPTRIDPQNLTPWVQRRLQVLRAEAEQLAGAARAVNQAAAAAPAQR